MTTYRHGHVIIDKNELAARCEKCGKSVCYPIGAPITLTAWNKEKQDFIELHRECQKGKK